MEPIQISESLASSCRVGDVQKIKEILTSHPHLLNAADNKLGWTSLYRAVMCGHLAATEFLLDLGADPNLQDKDGRSPLHQAVDNSQIKLLKLLLKNKADPNLFQKGIY